MRLEDRYDVWRTGAVVNLNFDLDGVIAFDRPGHDDAYGPRVPWTPASPGARA